MKQCLQSNSFSSFFQVISYDSPRGGVSVVTEKGESTSSHLLIQRASRDDSGVYKCVPANTVEAAINLHILRGMHEGY